MFGKFAAGYASLMLLTAVDLPAAEFKRAVVPTPFVLDNQTIAEIDVAVTELDEEMTLDVNQLLQALQGKVERSLLEKLQSAAVAGNIRMGELRKAGLEVEFDREKLELHLNTAPELRAASAISFGGTREKSFPEALSPSSFSTYVNLRGALDYGQQDAHGGRSGIQPARFDFEGAVNVNNWVVEGYGYFAEDEPRAWRRGDLRLVRDDPQRMVRYTAGDLAYPTTGFQSFQPMLGFSAKRNFSLQPYHVAEPRGSTSFFLKSASRVEVLVNGRPVQALQLPAGPHQIQDMFLAGGGNDMTLRITDDSGRTETMEFQFFFDSRLLAQGEQEFTYNIGAPSRPGPSGPIYDPERPTLSMFHRVGLSDTLTLGLNFQGNPEEQSLGGESVWATPAGTFQQDAALSQNSGAVGYAARLGYRLYEPGLDWGGSLSSFAQYQSRRFASVGSELRDEWTDNDSAWEFGARYSQRLPWGMHAGLGGNLQLRRSAPRRLKGVSLFFGKRFAGNSFADVTLDRRDTILGRTEYRAYLSMTLYLNGPGDSVHSTFDSSSRSARLAWRHLPENQFGGLDAEAGIEHSPGEYGFVGSSRYVGSRGEASLSQEISDFEGRSGSLDSRTRLRAATALVYADGQLAISRPVRDSFAIVAAHPQLAGQKIGIDPAGGRPLARIDRLGPAVAPDLHPYLYRRISVDAPELPAGYDIGSGWHTVHPTYKSGTVIRVGSGASVIATGILESAGGEPLRLRAGTITAEPGSAEESIEFFTNRDGRFYADGLKPGAYRMRLNEAPDQAVRFEIPADKIGAFEIGTLTWPGEL